MAKGALDTADGRWLALPTSAGYVPEDAGVGALVVAAAARRRHDPFQLARKAKRAGRTQLDRAAGHLATARQRAGTWRDVARALREDTLPPADADGAVCAAVRTLQDGAKLGLADLPPLADAVEYHAAAALARATETAAQVQTLAMALSVAQAKQQAQFWDRCAKNALSDRGRLLYATMAGVHRKKGRARAETYSAIAPRKHRRKPDKERRPVPAGLIRKQHRDSLFIGSPTP